MVAVDQVIDIGEDDYCYGVGTLTLRVTHVYPRPYPAAEWIRVLGIEIRYDGTEGEHRDVQVRASALWKAAPKPRKRSTGQQGSAV
jgi:hypothetical protein